MGAQAIMIVYAIIAIILIIYSIVSFSYYLSNRAINRKSSDFTTIGYYLFYILLAIVMILALVSLPSTINYIRHHE